MQNHNTRAPTHNTITLFSDIASTGMVFYIGYTVTGNDYPLIIDILTAPYVVAAIALCLALHITIESRLWLHSGLYAMGLLTICGLA